jgi:hypothetical protein
MTRRLVLAAVLTTVVGGGVAASSAQASTSDPGVKKICVVAIGSGDNPSEDGICVWTPDLPFLTRN